MITVTTQAVDMVHATALVLGGIALFFAILRLIWK